MIPFPIFIGYDSREIVAYHVLAQSIHARATYPVSIAPLSLTQLPGVGYTRRRGEKDSTEFSISRFLVPWLCGYEGYALFMDCDFLCRADIMDLSPLAGPEDEEGPEVWVCQHDYTPKSETKFLGASQLAYPRKNWSSLMLFNNAKCRALTPEYVMDASGLMLHRFEWAKDPIGRLPLEWNYLVGEANQSMEPPRMVHFTNGGPWLAEYASVEYADEWRLEHMRLNHPMRG